MGDDPTEGSVSATDKLALALCSDEAARTALGTCLMVRRT